MIFLYRVPRMCRILVCKRRKLLRGRRHGVFRKLQRFAGLPGQVSRIRRSRLVHHRGKLRRHLCADTDYKDLPEQLYSGHDVERFKFKTPEVKTVKIIVLITLLSVRVCSGQRAFEQQQQHKFSRHFRILSRNCVGRPIRTARERMRMFRWVSQNDIKLADLAYRAIGQNYVITRERKRVLAPNNTYNHLFWHFCWVPPISVNFAFWHLKIQLTNTVYNFRNYSSNLAKLRQVEQK